MSKSILVMIFIFSINPFSHGICHANPVGLHQRSFSHTEIHDSPNYWMYLWEERLRDEYSHVQNKLSTTKEYNQIKKSLALTFFNQYTHELKHTAYKKIRTLREEGILSQKDEEEYASYIIRVELRLHNQG